MASRRMFSKDVVCSDRFLDMPASAQALYFQYGLEADDDGFVSAPKKILRLTNASDDDLKILVAKGFLIPFDSGVVVIRDWKINNYLRRDRYTPTRFKEEFEQLDTIDDRYQLHVLAVGIPDDNHVVDMRDTQVRLGKDSIGKGSINNNVGRKMSHFTPPTVEEVQEYCFERGNAVDAQSFVDFYTSKGSPNVLRLWAADGSYSEQVASSNFMRSYRNEAKKQEEYEKLPADMQQMIDQTNRNSYSAQIREKNRDAIQIMTTTENAEIEAKDEPTGISQQSDERLKKLIEDFRQI